MRHFKPVVKQLLFIIGSIMVSMGSVFASNPVDTSHHYSPYVDITLCDHWSFRYFDREPLDLMAASKVSGVRDFHLAFINDAGSCEPAWGGQSDYSVNAGWASHLTNELQANNIPYTISFGGEGGKDLSKECNENQLVQVYEQIIKTYHPDGLDFDIENDTPKITKILFALQKIQSAHPALKISFTLPVLPEGLTEEGKNIVSKAKAANVNFVVNVMTMDYGQDCKLTMSHYAVQSAKNTFEYLKTLYPGKTDAEVWQKIAVTPLIGVNDSCNQKFTLADVDAVRNYERLNKFAFLSMWSFSRDMPCSINACTPTCSGLNLQSKPYEFSQHFLQKN